VFSFFAECRAKEIEAKACEANYDILRCWPFVLISLRQAATKRAENSVTISMDSRGSNEVCPLNENAELHEEGSHRMLEGRDRTVGVGEGGLKMREDLRCRPVRGFRRLGRRAPRRQCRADFALAQVEPFPDAMPGPVTSPAVGDDADRSGNAAGDGALQESPQRAGGHAQASDLIGEPDTESSTAAASPMAVVAKDPPSADGLALGVAFVVAAQKAVANQRANRFAMRTWHLLESFRNRAPFLIATAKPTLLAHVRPTLRENR
jgi:hypothetical protein